MCASEKPVVECSREVESQSSCISVARTWAWSHHQSSRKPNRNALLPGFLLPVISCTQVSIQPLLLPSSQPRLSQPSSPGVSFSLPPYPIFPQISRPGVSCTHPGVSLPSFSLSSFLPSLLSSFPVSPTPASIFPDFIPQTD